MARAHPRGARWWPKILLSTMVFIGFISILEGGSYLFGRFEGPENPLRGGYIREVGQHDFLLFWSLIPGYEDETGRISINSSGLRGPEIPVKSEGELRLLSLGESTTFAARLPYQDSYSALLEDHLKSVSQNRTVRVINAGVPGYTLFQGTQFLRDRGVALKPDVVLLYFGFNDFLSVSFLADRSGDGRTPAAGLNDEQLFLEREKLSRRLEQAMIKCSNLYRGLVYNFKRSLGGEVGGAVEVDSSRVRVPKELRRRLLNQILELCVDKDIKLVVIVPWYLSFSEHAELLREFGQQDGVELVDLPMIHSDANLPSARADYFVDSIHPNAEGHRLIAKAIADHIGNGLLQEAR